MLCVVLYISELIRLKKFVLLLLFVLLFCVLFEVNIVDELDWCSCRQG